MSAGHDEGSPAKRYADQYRKTRAEVVEEFRIIVAKQLSAWLTVEDTRWQTLIDKMDSIDVDVDDLIL